MPWEIVWHESFTALPAGLLTVAALLAGRGVRRWRRAPIPAVFLLPAAFCLLTAAAALAANRYEGTRTSFSNAAGWPRTEEYNRAFFARLREAGVENPEALWDSGEPVEGLYENRPGLEADLEALHAEFVAGQQRIADATAARLAADPLVRAIRPWRAAWWWRDLPAAALTAGAAFALLAAGCGARWGPARAGGMPPA